MNLCALPRCPTGSYAAHDSQLCEDCIGWVVATLRDTEECIAHLSPIKPVRPGQASMGNSYESGSPAADHVLVMLDPRSASNGWQTEWGGMGRIDRPDDQRDPLLSVDVLGSWAELAGWPAGQRTVRDAVSALLVNHRWVTAQTWVCDYVDELTRLHRQAAAAIGDGPPKPVATCIRVFPDGMCGGGVVVWHRLDDTGHHADGGARCLTCRKSYAGPDLVRLRLAQREAG